MKLYKYQRYSHCSAIGNEYTNSVNTMNARFCSRSVSDFAADAIVSGVDSWGFASWVDELLTLLRELEFSLYPAGVVISVGPVWLR